MQSIQWVPSFDLSIYPHAYGIPSDTHPFQKPTATPALVPPYCHSQLPSHRRSDETRHRRVEPFTFLLCQKSAAQQHCELVTWDDLCIHWRTWRLQRFQMIHTEIYHIDYHTEIYNTDPYRFTIQKKILHCYQMIFNTDLMIHQFVSSNPLIFKYRFNHLNEWIQVI